MKNSKEYSKKIAKLYRELKRKGPKPVKVSYDDPADALVQAVVSENLTEAAAQAAIKRFHEHFIDWNDLRVSLTEEMLELLDDQSPSADKIASTLTTTLRDVFEKHKMVSLESLKKMGKRPARAALEEIAGISPFVVDYCMLTALQGHAIPLTKDMLEVLRTEELVSPDADEQEIEGFLTRQIAANNAYEFYSLLRHYCQLQAATKKKKAKAENKKAKTEEKTKKVTKAKKAAKPKVKAENKTAKVAKKKKTAKNKK